MRWIDVAGELDDYVEKGDLAHCIERVSQIIAAMSQTPFHLVLKSDFTNNPRQVAYHFDTFFAEERGFALGAMYTETNGFYINPDRWYFELFGYRVSGVEGGYDWLAYWDTFYEESITLTGMEALQQVYAEYEAAEDYSNALLSEAKDLSDLLVVYKFQYLIAQSAPFMQKVRCPILATAHDYDILLKIKPSPVDQ